MLFLVLYVGAIVVLFLFVVMMLNVRILELNERIISYVPIAVVIVLIFFLLILSVITNNFLDDSTDSTLKEIFLKTSPNVLNEKQLTFSFFQNLNTYSNLNLIAALLYTDYVYLFLLAGMALLVAMLGSIVLTLNNSHKSKRQDYYTQTNKTIVKAIRHLK
jgi:NADH:ubiquinone oxidoreductase subunit 6 (subunit J)